jgi:hypothetical protein
MKLTEVVGMTLMLLLTALCVAVICFPMPEVYQYLVR